MATTFHDQDSPPGSRPYAANAIQRGRMKTAAWLHQQYPSVVPSILPIGPLSPTLRSLTPVGDRFVVEDNTVLTPSTTHTLPRNHISTPTALQHQHPSQTRHTNVHRPDTIYTCPWHGCKLDNNNKNCFSTLDNTEMRIGYALDYAERGHGLSIDALELDDTMSPFEQKELLERRSINLRSRTGDLAEDERVEESPWQEGDVLDDPDYSTYTSHESREAGYMEFVRQSHYFEANAGRHGVVLPCIWLKNELILTREVKRMKLVSCHPARESQQRLSRSGEFPFLDAIPEPFGKVDEQVAEAEEQELTADDDGLQFEDNPDLDWSDEG